MAWGNKNKKGKKVKVNKVERPEPPKPVKAAPAKAAPVVKPVAPVVKPVAKGADPKVAIHMLANAMIDGIQYTAGQEFTGSMRLYKQLGTSCVSMAKWNSMKAKGGLSSVRK